MTPQEKRKSNINACIKDSFDKVPKLIIDMTKATACAVSDVIGCVDTGSCAVFFDEEDGLVEIVFPYDHKRLTIEYNIITGVFQVYRSKIGEHQEFRYESELKDTTEHVAWLLGMQPRDFEFGMHKGQKTDVIMSSNPHNWDITEEQAENWEHSILEKIHAAKKIADSIIDGLKERQ
ncbi:hypothetical protein EBT16_00960 [bacterium]|nr:hypothetical protein [bacterium]